MRSFKKAIFRHSDISTGALMLSLRSTSFSEDGDGGCELGIIQSCYVHTASGGMVIAGGDTVYNMVMTLFNGNNKFWLLQAQISAVGDPMYVCQIDSAGLILGVYSLCAT